MFIPAYSQVRKERKLTGFSAGLLVEKEEAAGRVSGLEMKWPLVPACVSVAHAIQPPQTTPKLAPFCFQSRLYGVSEL